MSDLSINVSEFLFEKVQKLENIVRSLVEGLSPPKYDTSLENPGFRFEEPTSLHLQILKSVRIVSGLHASLCLLERGFTQEIGVLLRTIHDFITEIEFLHDAHTQVPSVGALRNANLKPQEFVDLFFGKQVKKTDLEIEQKNAPMISRKHIRAGSARSLEPFAEKTRVRRMLERIEDILGGYVHGEYPHIMELFVQTDPITGYGIFCMNGMLGTRRVNELEWQIASFIMKAGTSIALIAQSLGQSKFVDEIKNIRHQIENSDLYQR